MKYRSIAYWEGAATGLVAGILAGVIWPRLFCGSAKPSAHEVLQAINDAPEETKSKPFVSRRDGPESAGNPALVAGMRDKSALEFRQPGAPGPRSGAESLMMPGRPGKEIDPRSKVRVSTRTLSLGAKTLARRQPPRKVKHRPPESPTS